MALFSDKDKPIKESSFHNFMESGNDPLGKFRPGVLVKIIEGFDYPHGTIGMFLKARTLPRRHSTPDTDYLVLIGEEQWYFDAFEIEVL